MFNHIHSPRFDEGNYLTSSATAYIL